MLLAAKVKVAAPAEQKNQASEHNKSNQNFPRIRLLYKKKASVG